MAVARLALRNLQQMVSSSSSLLGHNLGERSIGGVHRQRWNDEMLKRFMATVTDKDSDDKQKQVSVSDGENKFRLQNDYAPPLFEFFPSGLGDALMQATENINRLFDTLDLTPFQSMARIKEQDDCYKMSYDIPGLTKEDVKITIDDGVLNIKGEHKGGGGSEEDDRWSARSYGNYNTSLVLPDDANVDDIKAELKDGVLSIIVPKTEQSKKDVKQVQIN
ncbi:26.5 kDa heat shock protein, mitochondrial-like isoform X2 [Hibiscus syriacus]|uniref:26.5 kDa heat shock protein, mitochondrial-like isoform X2 n=1 Tax=Hibiscus syriacus TaxID=106335 RepID=UPI0019233ECD|nr:26.5 kDa heat shock protein, mitochondrial-like isoform X2 [Hibiscus syriacus]